MNKRMVTYLLPVLVIAIVVGVRHLAWAETGAGLMTKEELKTRLADANTHVLDVRTGRDWSSSEFKIQGADRTNPGEFDAWASKYPKSATLVLYCA